MVMQIFHIKLLLEATMNKFINSVALPVFLELLRYDRRGLGLHYFQPLEERKKITQISNTLASSAE